MHVITFYGNIASGKTRLARVLTSAIPTLAYVNDDAISTMLGNGDYAFGYKALDPEFLQDTLRLISLGVLASGHDVLIDSPAHTNKRRENFRFDEHNVQHISLNTGWDFPVVHAERRVKDNARGFGYEQWLKAAVELDAEREAPSSPWQSWSMEQVLSILRGKKYTLESVGQLLGLLRQHYGSS